MLTMYSHFITVSVVCLCSSMLINLSLAMYSTPLLNDTTARVVLEQLNERVRLAQTYTHTAKWAFTTNLTIVTQQAYIDAIVDYGNLRHEHTEYIRLLDIAHLNEENQRQFNLLAVPGIEALGRRQGLEFQRLVTSMSWNVSTARVCVGRLCARSEYLDTYSSYDANILKFIWRRLADKTSNCLRSKYLRYLELGQRAAQATGFHNYDKLFTGNYDDPHIGPKIRLLWSQVRPLYIKLHAYLRDKLKIMYPDNLLPADGTIPEQLFHVNKFSSLIPFPEKPEIASIDATIRAQHLNVLDIVDMAEQTYHSLGWPSLPTDFRRNSQFVRPFRRRAVCHYQSFDFYRTGYNRMQICATPSSFSLKTIQEGIASNYYHMFYASQPQVFRQPASRAFELAIGKAVGISALSISSWKRRGLLPVATNHLDCEVQLNTLVIQGLIILRRMAIDYTVDQWRHEVFQGQVQTHNLNRRYWQLMVRIAGVTPPMTRSENQLDALSNWHVASDEPMDTYFTGQIMAFQIHQTLCQVTQPDVPLHLCDIQGHPVAGDHLKRVLVDGGSRHWTDQLEQLTGSKDMSVSSLLQYFQPLNDYLDGQLVGKHVGWYAANVNNYF